MEEKYSMDEILSPLGGESNLRMMCNADKFIYTPSLSGDGTDVVNFIVDNMLIFVYYYYSNLLKVPRWGLVILDSNTLERIVRYSDTSSYVLVRAFEYYTRYSLSF